MHLLIGPAAAAQTLALRGRGTGDTHRYIEVTCHVRLEEERNHRHRDRPAFGPPKFELRPPNGSNPGMEDLFEPVPSIRVRENSSSQFIAPQSSVGSDDVLAEGLLDFQQSRLARFDHLPRDRVGVNDRDPALLEQLSGG